MILNLLFDLCRWKVEDEGVEVFHGVMVDCHLFLIEAMGAAIATAAQANATRGQGAASNLQRFKAHHPPTFTGGGDPMVVDHWFHQIERILRAMEITSDTTRITLASFQLEGESQI